MPTRDADESEARTRRLRIDKRLRAAGWKVVPFDPAQAPSAHTNHAVEEYPTGNGPADYALLAEGKLLGIVEGKRRATGAQNVLSQAKRYAQGLRPSPPFLYSSNGETIWHRDARHEMNLSRPLPHFHRPDALLEMIQRDFEDGTAWFAANQEWHERLRPYQIDANRAIEQAVAARKRQMLVAMATGTGKTFTMVHSAYRFMKSGIARRILFLVDRRALALQAVRAFQSFDPEPGKKFSSLYEVFHQSFHREDLGDEDRFDPKVMPNEYLTAPARKHAFVYVCTIQRMAINLFGRGAAFGQGDEAADEDAGELDIPIHAFDLVIADECHRGYTTAELSVWRNTLDHFDAIKVGLTATPAAHTKAYFNDVVFRYEYERAVREGFLVDYDVVKVSSDVRLSGVFLKAGEHVGVVDPETGGERLDILDDERAYDSTEVERRVTSPDSNRKILEEVAKYAAEHEERHGRFPKILIFAVNDLPHRSHADQLVRLAREVLARGEAFVEKITGSPTVDRPLQRIREFRNRPKPGVAVTVDMLSTGVDIPDLEFIVFLRPVKSRILFEQMLGRGTRKGEKFLDKSHFTVFDCFGGTLLEYFRSASAFTVDPPEQPSRTIREVVQAIRDNVDRPYNVRSLVRRLQRVDKEMSGDARELFAAHVPDGDVVRFARTLPQALQRDFAGTMKLLRADAFLDLLENYPRAKQPFVIGYESKDRVVSEYLIRDGAGNEYKPQDYLTAFGSFVQRNKDRIQALEILLKRPSDWSGKALEELRDKLKSAPERFTEKNLQEAYQRQYHKAAADIISLVKFVAGQVKKTLSAEERVRRAFERVAAGRTFTRDQEKWLDRIRDHMVENLSIDPEDFDAALNLGGAGGWKAADRAFDGKLRPLLREFNKEVAA